MRSFNRDGSEVEVSISARRVLDDAGRLRCYEGSLTDIGERKARTTPTALEMLPEIPDAADHGRGEPARN